MQSLFRTDYIIIKIDLVFFLIRLTDYVPYMLESLSHALVDPSAYVQKTALVSCIKLFHLSPKHVLGR